MVEAMVKNALFKTLDAYLINFRKDQINFSSWSGKGAVRGVQVNLDKMNTFLGNVRVPGLLCGTLRHPFRSPASLLKRSFHHGIAFLILLRSPVWHLTF